MKRYIADKKNREKSRAVTITWPASAGKEGKVQLVGAFTTPPWKVIKRGTL